MHFFFIGVKAPNCLFCWHCSREMKIISCEPTVCSCSICQCELTECLLFWFAFPSFTVILATQSFNIWCVLCSTLGEGRAYTTGRMWTQDGRLVISTAQEGVLRTRKPQPDETKAKLWWRGLWYVVCDLWLVQSNGRLWSCWCWWSAEFRMGVGCCTWTWLLQSRAGRASCCIVHHQPQLLHSPCPLHLSHLLHQHLLHQPRSLYQFKLLHAAYRLPLP